MDIPRRAADETVWVGQAKLGSQRAFKALYDAHVTPLFRFLKQFSSADSLVEEWVQRAFIKAFERIGQFQGKSKFSTWLFQIALNEMRMDQRRSTIVSFEGMEGIAECASDEGDQFEWDETIRSLLEELSDAQRLVFILYEVEGYTHAEIAGMLNVKESTSRTILSRTKQWLQEQWKEKGR